MGYLQPVEYENFGLPSDTADDWVTSASALMDSYCRRESLAVVQYMERIRVMDGASTVRLSYLPLAAQAPADSALVAVRARYGRPRRGEMAYPIEAEIVWAFGLPGSWVDLDCSRVEYESQSGEVDFPTNVLSLPWNEVEVTYTAGLATLPDAVKCACAQIVRNAQATPALNVKRGRVDTMQVEYFSNSLIDDAVKSWLRPYVSRKVG